ncbi:MAG: phosphopantothenoylcysteine decarboxylase [Kiritimatiellia bacterium]
MRFVITAGPTREYLDPVRFLSNPSTGKMGFAVARAAAARGHDVVLVAGPVVLKTPKGVARRDVVSAREMLAAVEEVLSCGAEPTVFISTAAVADWRPATCATRKLKKDRMTGVLKLVRNPDILKTLARKYTSSRARTHRRLYLVGFAAETNDVLREAARKCAAKRLEMIVANDVTQQGCGFGTDTNRVVFLRKDGSMEALPLMSKRRVAERIVRICEDFCA